MLRAESAVERPRRACPVLTGWPGSFTLKKMYRFPSKSCIPRLNLEIKTVKYYSFSQDPTGQNANLKPSSANLYSKLAPDGKDYRKKHT